MSYYESDYILRMIRDLCKAISRLIFQKDITEEELGETLEDEEKKQKYKKLVRLLKERQYQECLQLLTSTFEANNLDDLKIALTIYDDLNSLDDETLKKGNLTRNEVFEGMNDIAKHYGIAL